MTIVDTVTSTHDDYGHSVFILSTIISEFRTVTNIATIIDLFNIIICDIKRHENLMYVSQFASLFNRLTSLQHMSHLT